MILSQVQKGEPSFVLVISHVLQQFVLSLNLISLFVRLLCTNIGARESEELGINLKLSQESTLVECMYREENTNILTLTEDKHLYLQKSSCWLVSLYFKKLLNLDALQVSYTVLEDLQKTYINAKYLINMSILNSNNIGKLRFYTKICTSFNLKTCLNIQKMRGQV